MSVASWGDGCFPSPHTFHRRSGVGLVAASAPAGEREAELLRKLPLSACDREHETCHPHYSVAVSVSLRCLAH